MMRSPGNLPPSQITHFTGDSNPINPKLPLNYYFPAIIKLIFFYDPLMIPFNQSGELSFQMTDSSDLHLHNQPHHNQHKDEQHNCHTEHALMASTSTSFSKDVKRKGRRPSLLTSSSMEEKGHGFDMATATNRKMIHREIERKRREEMAALYSSLRSLLPLEYIKGKRSMSDHVTAAYNYIKTLEQNVKDLQETREHLKSQWSDSGGGGGGHDPPTGSSTGAGGSSRIQVEVSRSGSVAVEISSGDGSDREGGAPSSKILKVLLEEGLSVANCTTTRVKDKCWVHVIHCQVQDITRLEASRLQQRLAAKFESL